MTRAARILAVGGVLAAARPAAGDEGNAGARAAKTGPSVAALAGYALETGTITGGGVDAYRLGVGARAGTTLPFHLYLGGTFVVHVGSDATASGDGGASYEARYHTTYGGAEIGYDLDLGPVLLRPYAGLGLLAAVGHTTVRAASAGQREAFFYVAPGLLAAYRVRPFFAGLDLRMPLPFAEIASRWAPAAMLAVGVELGSSAR